MSKFLHALLSSADIFQSQLFWIFFGGEFHQSVNSLNPDEARSGSQCLQRLFCCLMILFKRNFFFKKNLPAYNIIEVSNSLDQA